jgi:C2H2 type zinc finger protein
MVCYQCEKCESSFKQKGHYNYHRKANACKVRPFKCPNCNKGFTASSNMYRHIKVKHSSDAEMINKDQNNREILDKLAVMQSQLDELKKENNALKIVGSVGSINNGTINNITNNITIVAYGKEDMSQIDRDDIIRALKTGFNSTKRLTEIVHFNPRYPKYSNIKRSNYNMKNKIMYHNGNEWVTTSDPHMIDDLYNRKRDFIEENIEYYQDALTKGDMARLQRWLDVDDDDQRITRIKTDLREMLFNKKHIAETNESNATVQFVSIEDLDSIEEKVVKTQSASKYNTKIIKVKKRKLAGRPGTKRKTVRVKRSK